MMFNDNYIKAFFAYVELKIDNVQADVLSELWDKMTVKCSGEYKNGKKCTRMAEFDKDTCKIHTKKGNSRANKNINSGEKCKYHLIERSTKMFKRCTKIVTDDDTYCSRHKKINDIPEIERCVERIGDIICGRQKSKRGKTCSAHKTMKKMGKGNVSEDRCDNDNIDVTENNNIHENESNNEEVSIVDDDATTVVEPSLIDNNEENDDSFFVENDNNENDEQQQVFVNEEEVVQEQNNENDDENTLLDKSYSCDCECPEDEAEMNVHYNEKCFNILQIQACIIKRNKKIEKFSEDFLLYVLKKLSDENKLKSWSINTEKYIKHLFPKVFEQYNSHFE